MKAGTSIQSNSTYLETYLSSYNFVELKLDGVFRHPDAHLPREVSIYMYLCTQWHNFETVRRAPLRKILAQILQNQTNLASWKILENSD